jgi:predicted lactoylglutathione lyase
MCKKREFLISRQRFKSFIANSISIYRSYASLLIIYTHQSHQSVAIVSVKKLHGDHSSLKLPLVTLRIACCC